MKRPFDLLTVGVQSADGSRQGNRERPPDQTVGWLTHCHRWHDWQQEADLLCG